MNFENIDILIQRAKLLRNREYSRAMTALDEALALAIKENYRQGVALVIREKASCHLSQRNYKQALSGFTEALQFFKDLNDRENVLACLSEISGIYCKLGDIASALNYLLDSLKINSDSGDDNGIAASFNEIGKLHVYLSEYDEAIDHFKKALKIFETIKNKKEMVNSYFLIGNAYNWKNDHDKALYYLLRAVNSLEQLQDTESKAKTLGSLAILYTKLSEFDKALAHFKQALTIAENGARPVVIAQLLKSMGNLYIELTQYDKAIEVLHRALKIAENSPLEAQLVKIHEFLSTAYEKLGDTKSALEHYKLYIEQEKQITSEEVSLKTKALHIRYDLEELKKQKEIAELSDKLKEQFLANVSHEIRTPMNGVLGMTHLLRKTNPTQEQLEYIDAIKLSANNLMMIINDILDFSKINAGKIEFSETEFNLRELVKGLLQIFRVKAEEKRIQLGCTVDYHIQDNLMGDALRLNQILTNLIGNAVKFTEKGKVNLDIKLLEINDQQCRLRLKISDTGCGIPEHKLNSVFDSFEQVENNKRRFEGTGLGLTIVKQLVELQGGTIHVNSRLNEGSDFIVEMTFRISKQKQAVTPAVVLPEIEEKDFSHVRILVVEDNKVNQLLMKNMLKKFGFVNFDTAENGRVALQKCKEHDFDLILMDIQMPEMDGYEITKELRSKYRPEISTIPIIAITADASEKEKQKARDAGMNDYVVKPYTPEELYASLVKFVHDAPEVRTKSSPEVRASRLEPGMDLAFLDKFTGGDVALTIQLLEIFLKQVPDATRKLTEHIPNKNWKEVHAVAHKLKSSIAIFELNELKKLITNIEEYARDGEQLEVVPTLFSQFREGAKVAMRNLEAELNRLKVAVK